MCVVCMAGKSLVTFTALSKHKDTLQITSAAPRRPEGIVIWVLLIALVLSTRSTFLNQIVPLYLTICKLFLAEMSLWPSIISSFQSVNNDVCSLLQKMKRIYFDT